jgi:hypothetical protein
MSIVVIAIVLPLIALYRHVVNVLPVMTAMLVIAHHHLMMVVIVVDVKEKLK